MFKVSGNKVYLTRGDSAVFELTVKDAEGSTYDFSSDTVVFSMKKNCNDPNVLIQKTFDENGKITFEPEDTNRLPFGSYLYDVQLTHTDGDVTTIDTIIVPSTFEIGAEVNY